MEFYDCVLKTPSRWLIYGPSGSGKSTFVEKLMHDCNYLFETNFDTIFYCSSQSFPKNKYNGEIPIYESEVITPEYVETLDPNNNNLIILDDNMHNVSNDILVSDLFTKKSHHKNITVIMLVQNLFPKSKYMRDISLNCNYIVLMRNPREMRQIKTLAYQIDGDSGDFIINSYKNATSDNPYSYLLLDLCQETPEMLKLRSNIFYDEKPHVVYTKKSQKI